MLRFLCLMLVFSFSQGLFAIEKEQKLVKNNSIKKMEKFKWEDASTFTYSTHNKSRFDPAYYGSKNPNKEALFMQSLDLLLSKPLHPEDKENDRQKRFFEKLNLASSGLSNVSAGQDSTCDDYACIFSYYCYNWGLFGVEQNTKIAQSYLDKIPKSVQIKDATIEAVIELVTSFKEYLMKKNLFENSREEHLNRIVLGILNDKEEKEKMPPEQVFNLSKLTDIKRRNKLKINVEDKKVENKQVEDIFNAKISKTKSSLKRSSLSNLPKTKNTNNWNPIEFYHVDEKKHSLHSLDGIEEEDNF